MLFADLGDIEGWAPREQERVRRAVRFYYDQPLAAVLLTRAGVDGAVARVDGERLQRAARASAANVAEAQRAGELPGDIDSAHAGAMLMGGAALVLARAAAAVARDRPPTNSPPCSGRWSRVSSGCTDADLSALADVLIGPLVVRRLAPDAWRTVVAGETPVARRRYPPRTGP